LDIQEREWFLVEGAVASEDLVKVPEKLVLNVKQTKSRENGPSTPL
jgi:hypothetical protein